MYYIFTQPFHHINLVLCGGGGAKGDSRRSTARRRRMRKKLERSGWGYQSCVRVTGRQRSEMRTLMKESKKGEQNCWRMSETIVLHIQKYFHFDFEKHRIAVLHLLKKSGEILTNIGFLLSFLQDLKKTTQRTPFYSQSVITRFHLYLLLLTNKNICEHALVSILVFSTNDLITMACNLCTHLFCSFPALSKSSMTQAYLESNSEV